MTKGEKKNDEYTDNTINTELIQTLLLIILSNHHCSFYYNNNNKNCISHYSMPWFLSM